MHEANWNWESYYQDTLTIKEPRKTVLLADKYFQIEKKIGCAVDLGAGTGRDTLFLLEQGWHVLAIDGEETSIDILLKRVDPSKHSDLEVMVATFSKMNLPNDIDLINASFSLPFCQPKEFSQCWEYIVDHLSVGGRFSGQFFGEKDAWATRSDLTIHSHEEILQLFEKQFDIEYFCIEEGLIPGANGKMKQTHVYHVVAKKIKSTPIR